MAVGGVRRILDFILNRPKQERREDKVSKEERDVKDKIAIVTGSNHGIGFHTALELAKRRAHIVLACRDLTKAEVAKGRILELVPDCQVTVMLLDLNEFGMIRSFAHNVRRTFLHVDILIHNAGIYKFDPQLTKTKDGFESHFGTNHLGPFLLTILLMGHLKRAPSARVICVSSVLLKLAKLDINNLNMENESLGFRNMVPYANSKLCNALFVKELAKRLENTSVKAYAVCPGIVFANTLAEESWIKKQFIKVALKFAMFDAYEGAATSVYCALSEALENETGKFYRFLARYDDIEPYLSSKQAEDLWKVSEGFVKMRYPPRPAPTTTRCVDMFEGKYDDQESH